MELDLAQLYRAAQAGTSGGPGRAGERYLHRPFLFAQLLHFRERRVHLSDEVVPRPVINGRVLALISYLSFWRYFLNASQKRCPGNGLALVYK